MTTSGGAPVADNQNSVTAGPRGPVMMQDYPLIEKLAHQNRERIPERVVHAKGWGAYGTLTVTEDISRYTRAEIFSEIDKRTQLLTRFSTVAGELGAADAERDVRGFAIKFYTREGNWDLVGKITRRYSSSGIRSSFPDFIRTQRPFRKGLSGRCRCGFRKVVETDLEPPCGRRPPESSIAARRCVIRLI